MPVMSCRGTRNWPPIWEAENKSAILQKISGEIGRLKDAFIDATRKNRCFLFMEHEGAGYIAALDFDDPRFCPLFVQVLRRHLGASIKDIGDLDIGQEFNPPLL
jgi:hypothetical protein